MKRLNRKAMLLIATVVLLVSTFALAQTGTVNIDFSPRGLMQGLFVGQASMASSTHKVTKMLAGSITVDFAAQTITCVDSGAITVTGALTGDACFVGAPAAATANSNFTCYVSAANTVLVRFCAAGTAADPPSATYNVRVVSNQ